MKNIHVLPTDKPSRLYQLKNDILRLDYKIDRGEANKHIYITSDEEIKRSDWMYDSEENDILQRSDVKDINGYIEKFCKKIILTTDQDLIGVQAIDDGFLEWFCKNPSCEEVEVELEIIKRRDTTLFVPPLRKYKIIIPKEEPNPFELPNTLPDNVFYESLEPKQETLEEAKERYLDSPLPHSYRLAVEFGVKFQQERSYSEEEVLELLQDFANDLSDNVINIKFWFNKFKKK